METRWNKWMLSMLVLFDIGLILLIVGLVVAIFGY